MGRWTRACNTWSLGRISTKSLSQKRKDLWSVSVFNQCYHYSWYPDMRIYDLSSGYFVFVDSFVDSLWHGRDDKKITFQTEYDLLNVSDMSLIMNQMCMFLSWVSYFTAEMDILHKNVQPCVGIPGTSTVTGNINVLITHSRHNLHWFKVPEPCLPVEQFVHITFHCNYFWPLKSKYWPQLKTPCHHILHRQYIWKMSACC